MSSRGGKNGVIFQANLAGKSRKSCWNWPWTVEHDGTWGIWNEMNFHSIPELVVLVEWCTLMLFVRKWTCIILHRGSSQWQVFHVTGEKSCHCTGFLGKDMWILMVSLVLRVYWWYFLKHRNWRSQNVSEVPWIGTVSKEIPATLGRFLVTRYSSMTCCFQTHHISSMLFAAIHLHL